MPVLLLELFPNFLPLDRLLHKLAILPMNLLREQRPYEFIAPKYSPWFRPFLNMLTRLSLRIQHKVESVEIVGGVTVSKLAAAGHSILVTPNHADHADPELMMTAARRGGYAFHFMAAREGFEMSSIESFWPISSTATLGCISLRIRRWIESPRRYSNWKKT